MIWEEVLLGARHSGGCSPQDDAWQYQAQSRGIQPQGTFYRRGQPPRSHGRGRREGQIIVCRDTPLPPARQWKVAALTHILQVVVLAAAGSFANNVHSSSHSWQIADNIADDNVYVPCFCPSFYHSFVGTFTSARMGPGYDWWGLEKVLKLSVSPIPIAACNTLNQIPVFRGKEQKRRKKPAAFLLKCKLLKELNNWDSVCLPSVEWMK